MGISLAALLVMSVFFTGVLMMYRTTLFGNLVVSEAIDRSNEMWLERSETLITVEGAVADPPGGCTINVDLKNSGIRPVHNYQNMDLIVHFQSNPPEPIRLDYSAIQDPGALAPDNWTLVIDRTLFPFQPGIFDPGEDAVIHGRLGLPGAAIVDAVVVGTSNGSMAQYSTGPIQVSPC